MENFIEIVQQEWAIRALLASSMVGLMCGVLGCFIVLRNMALIGDALAHAILPGVVVAFIIVGYSALGFFVGSVIAGLLTAAGITWIQHNVKNQKRCSNWNSFYRYVCIRCHRYFRRFQRRGTFRLKRFSIWKCFRCFQ